MKYLIDANICILMLAGENERLRRRIQECTEGELAISSIAFAEVALGSWRGKAPPLIVIDQLRKVMPILPFEEGAARQYAQLPFARGSFNRLIAAHAVALDLTLVTNNERDFSDISGLRVENWTL